MRSKVKQTRGCGEDTVAEINISETQGLKQIGITLDTGHSNHLS